MKTISKLRKEVLRDHLTEKIKENQAKLYELNKQLVLETETKLLPLQIDILMDNISMLQTKLNIVQRNISKS